MLLDLSSVPVIETERLRLRLPRADDLDRFAEMYGDPEVMRYVGTGQTGTREDAWRGIAMMLGQWVMRGYGMYAVEDRSGRLLGRAGLIHPEGWPGLEIGWTFIRDSWGRGYATEAAKAALEDAFGRLRVQRLISLIHPENRASIRVAEKLGERFQSMISFKGMQVGLHAIDNPRQG